MYYFIDSTMLIGNVFVASLEKTGKRFVPWETISEFGDIVYKIYKKQDQELMLLFTKEYTEKFMDRYKNWFKEEVQNGELGLRLVDSISSINLRSEFRSLLSLETLKVFTVAEEKVFGEK